MWHRAEIISNITDNKVKLYYIDYGTTDTVRIDEIKYLMSDFSGIRSQVYRGRLSHIRPIEHRWSREASYLLLNLVVNLVIYAKATEVDREVCIQVNFYVLHIFITM